MGLAPRFPLPKPCRRQSGPVRPKRTLPGRPAGRGPQGRRAHGAGFRTPGLGHCAGQNLGEHTAIRFGRDAKRRAKLARSATSIGTGRTTRAGADADDIPKAPRVGKVHRRAWPLARVPPRQGASECNRPYRHRNVGLGSQLAGRNIASGWPSNLPLMGVAYRCSLYRPRCWPHFKPAILGHATRTLPKPAENAKVRLSRTTWSDKEWPIGGVPVRLGGGAGQCKR